MNSILIRFTLLALCLVAGNVLTVSGEDWYEYANFYQIYPRSFMDSDGDGIGDLNGITSRLDYIKFLGVTGIWLSPIFQSPMKDFGYDISDYRAIHKEFGTMEDFERLVKKCKELGIKLVLDFVPNHTSDEHEWFIKSIAGDENYKDYYVWADGTGTDKKDPPSNWQSIFKGNGWTLNATRNQFYYHQFLEQQPDLNYRNPKVVDAMKEILRFWLRKGVDGFRCDAVPFLFENNKDGTYKNEARYDGCTDQNEYNCLNHTETMDQDETFDMIYQWRAVVDEDEFKDSPRILMTEAYTNLENTLRFYGKTDESGKVATYGAHMPFNFELISHTNMDSKPSDFIIDIKNWLNGIPKGDKLHANWVLGNHDNRRLASRYRPTRADLFNILLKTLPGIAVTYQGEELAMTDVDISWEDTQDPQACRAGKDNFQKVTRDPARTPFQWDDTKNAGFTTAEKTWLPLAKNYTDCNAKLEILENVSNLNVFRRLMLLRATPTMKYGGLDIVALKDDKVLAYKREIKDSTSKASNDVFVILLNFDPTPQTVSLKDVEELKNLPDKLEVVVASVESTKLLMGDKIDTYSDIELDGDVGVVLVGSK